ARGQHGGGRARRERPGAGAARRRRHLRKDGLGGHDRARRRQGGDLPAAARRSQGNQAAARAAEALDAPRLVAEPRDIGPRLGLPGLDRRVVHVVALALLVDLRDSAADLEVREALARSDAVRFLGPCLGGLLVRLLARLRRILLALLEG